jgi:hypothetical protein
MARLAPQRRPRMFVAAPQIARREPTSVRSLPESRARLQAGRFSLVYRSNSTIGRCAVYCSCGGAETARTCRRSTACARANRRSEHPERSTRLVTIFYTFTSAYPASAARLVLIRKPRTSSAIRYSLARGHPVAPPSESSSSTSGHPVTAPPVSPAPVARRSSMPVSTRSVSRRMASLTVDLFIVV